VAQQRRVAVVGAGLAGLAAGLRLHERGDHVEIFERSRLLGGRATSFEIDGIEVDNGQHVFLGCCTEFIDFVTSAGMAQHLRLQPRFEALVLARNGTQGRLRTSPLPAPLHLAPSLLTYPHLSLPQKLTLAKALLNMQRRGERSERSRTTGETFEQWLQRNGQSQQTRRAFWDPFFIPALNAPFDRIDNADAMFVLKTAFMGDPSAARFGFSTVPLAHVAQAAAARLDGVHLSTAITTIEPSQTGAGLTLQLLDGRTMTFDACILAVPPRTAAKLLVDPARYGIEGLDRFDPFPIVDVHLWHDAGELGFDFAAAIGSPLQWIFEKAPGYLCCSFSAAEDYLRMPSERLEAFAWEEARAFIPSLRQANLIRSAVTRNPEATYLPQLGTQRPGQRTTHPAIALAGAWTNTGWPDTMESAVRSARIAADAIAGAPLQARESELAV
jgi:squalene-associated FAD-dependent desaturase